MSDNQPHPHQSPYDPYGTYAPRDPGAPHQGYAPQPAPGTAYGQQPYGAYGAYDPYATDPYAQQQPQPHQPQPAAYDPYAQQHQPQPAAAHAHAATAAPEPVPAGHPAPGPAPAPAPDPAPAAPAAPLKPNQIARAEGRSPIIPPGIQPAAVTALLALLLALAAPVARPVLAVPVVLLQAVTAAGWFRLNGMWPARQGIALAFLGGVATDAGLLATPHEDAPLVAIGTLGVWCLLVLVLQLRNRSSADERMYALTAGLTSSALAVLASGQLAAEPDAVVAGAAAVGLAVLFRALPLPGPVTLVLGLLAGAGGGLAAAQLTGMGTTAGALLGLAAGGCALIGLRVASYDYPSKFVHMTAGVALPLALAAPAVYVLGRALG
ncbi:hypothetical protein ADL22_03305 [Streptomyces sp. NRRL F-4489]|uniref:hypothetical protein n=1 Tax=Streptomyces sp. NRRL F-4489 TaxID=1609095 RepID=UPI000747BED7|nr:hypothetical protein [Streptomyces sp. NRRL F-4489]KUL54320.1 hypothetical protein ADL22_03305 [Streptomyces sp. NRRL F-4489]